MAYNPNGNEWTGECVICGERYTRYGCNADPVKIGQCCHRCDILKVTPARLNTLTGIPIEECEQISINAWMWGDFMNQPLDTQHES